MLFNLTAAELLVTEEDSPTLLIVRLHKRSMMCPDVFYDQCHKHFTLIHDTGEYSRESNFGHPSRYIGAELLSAYEPGKTFSPQAKLLPAW